MRVESLAILRVFEHRGLGAGDMIHQAEFGDAIVWDGGFVKHEPQREALLGLFREGYLVESPTHFTLTAKGADAVRSGGGAEGRAIVKTWWSAIDLAYSSYEELKHRRVVAQGWRHLGDISTLARFVPDGRDAFVSVTQMLGDTSYRGETWWEQDDRKPARAPTVMWNLLSIAVGDLVVAIEGTTVRGICQVNADASKSYDYQPEWEYGQTIGFPVTWQDWVPDRFGAAPQPPSRGVLGIRGLDQESDRVRLAWETFVGE